MAAPGEIPHGADNESVIPIGRVSGLYGVRGWVKVLSYATPADNILHYQPWLLRLDGQWRPVRVLDGRPHGKSVVAHLEGYDDRDLAAALRGADIAIRREQLAPAGAGEYYWVDLIGLHVINQEGVELGAVVELWETGANDVLVVRNGQEHLIPYVRGQVILEVDLAQRRILVDWPAEF